MRIDPDRISEALGGETWRIRLGPGVIGITGAAVIAAMGAIAVVAFALNGHPETLLLVIGGILGFMALFIGGSWVFAHLHKDLALLGGAHLLKLREMQMGAQDPTILLQQPPITGAPRLPKTGGDDSA